MRTDANTRQRRIFHYGGIWMLPLLLAFILSGVGCSTIQGLMQDDDTEAVVPPSEIVVQSAEYGVITQVTSALMKDREIRLGDIAITVDTDNGGIVVVIQPEDDIYRVGDRVRVIRDGQKFVRVQLL